MYEFFFRARATTSRTVVEIRWKRPQTSTVSWYIRVNYLVHWMYDVRTFFTAEVALNGFLRGTL